MEYDFIINSIKIILLSGKILIFCNFNSLSWKMVSAFYQTLNVNLLWTLDFSICIDSNEFQGGLCSHWSNPVRSVDQDWYLIYARSMKTTWIHIACKFVVGIF